MNIKTRCAKIWSYVNVIMLLMSVFSGCNAKDNEKEPIYNVVSESAPALTVDLSARGHEIVHGSAGFLYGISNPGVPDVNTLTPLKPKILATKGALGTEHPYGDALDVAEEFFLSGGEQVQMYCSNYYGVFGVTADAHEYGEVLETTIAPKVAEWKESMREKYPDIDSRIAYIPINEWTPINGVSDFNAAWEIYFTSIKASDPNARIAGPNDTSYRGHQGMMGFLSFCKANNCLPDIITWHELTVDSLSTMDEHIADYRSICKELEIEEKQVVINEYADFCDCGVPGRLVNWISRLEDNEVCGCLPFWHQANNINDLAADSNQGNGAWWVYKWYGDMSGETLAVSTENTSVEGFYGMSTIDDGKKSISVLCGGADGEALVRIKGLNKSEAFKTSDNVHVTVKAAYFSGYNGAHYEPDTILDGIFPVTNGTVEIPLTDTEASTAYSIIVTKTDEKPSSPSVGKFRAVYEAENAILMGELTIDQQNKPLDFPTYYCSGGLRVGGIDSEGDGIKYNIEVPSDGLYKLEFIYGNGVGSTRNNASTHNPENITQKLVIDGVESELNLPNTLFYSMEGSAVRYVDLSAGRHTVAVMYDGESGGFHDALYVSDVGAYGEGEPKFDRTYEAESADFNSFGGAKSASVESEYGGFTGSGYVTGLNSSQVIDGGGIRFIADIPESGLYYLGVRYRSSSDGKIRVYLDNTNLTFDSLLTHMEAKASKEWTEVWTAVFLRKGINIIDLDSDSDIMLDSVRVLTSGLDVSETIEAENAAGDFETAALNGTVYVSEMNADGQYLEFKYNAPADGRYQMTVYHSNNDLCGTHSYNIKIVDRDAVIEVNGEQAGHYFFPNTFSDGSFLEKTITLSLKAGDNTVRIYNDDRRHVLWGGSQSTPGTNVMENFTPNFDRFVITPTAYDASPEKLSYSVKTYSTAGGYVTASKDYASAGEKVTLKLYPEGSIKELIVNGKDIAEKLVTENYLVYTTEITIDEDAEILAVFEPAQVIEADAPPVPDTIVIDGQAYNPIGENLFKNGDFSDTSGKSTEQWYVGMNEDGHPRNGDTLRPYFDDNGKAVNLLPLSESGLLFTEKSEKTPENMFYFAKNGNGYCLTETVGEPWQSNAWNGSHSLLAYVDIKPDTDYCFSFRAKTDGGAASIRCGAINTENYVQKIYKTSDTLNFSGSGYMSCPNGDMQNVSGSWQEYKMVVNSGDGDRFIFNAYWLHMCSNLSLTDFRLNEVEKTGDRGTRIVSAENPPALVVKQGDSATMPEKIEAYARDGEKVSIRINWADTDKLTDKAGIYLIEGYAVPPEGFYIEEGALRAVLRMAVTE